MNHYLHGFLDEFLKLAAFPQQSGGDAPYDANVSQTMERTQGQTSRAALKSGQPLQAAPAPRPRAPTPLTTPNQMVDYASRAAGGSAK